MLPGCTDSPPKALTPNLFPVTFPFYVAFELPAFLLAIF